jgi:molybdopterin-guanine dinucleotide biosynthesis protein A
VTRIGVTGAVLSGGSSTRFGSDKFLHPFGQTTMGMAAIDVLRSSGVERVLVVGVDPAHDTPGTTRIAGTREGNGPLAAILDTLEFLGDGVLITLPCDVPYLATDDVAALLDSLGEGIDVVVAEADGIHPTVAAWSVESCTGPLRDAYSSGERALHRAITQLRMAAVVLDAERLRNVNTRDQLSGDHGAMRR